MGGLIVRWARCRQSQPDEGYPPTLLVQDAVTVSTPHLGANIANDTDKPGHW
jgi:triacylglycerol esterase/lipase EstA (alpha/beta hydrolase family)